MSEPKPMGEDLWDKQAGARDGTNGYLTAPADEAPAAPVKKAAKKKA